MERGIKNEITHWYYNGGVSYVWGSEWRKRMSYLNRKAS
jgi:hypothetical protein